MAEKKRKSSTADTSLDGFRIGAVSKITQVPVDTLRAWERRYGVVSPQRSGSSARLFTPADVERLQLIKRLVDSGHAIGSIARLEAGELEARLKLHERDARASREATETVGSLVVFREPEVHPINLDAPGFSDIKVVASHHNWGEFEADALARRPDAVVLQVAALLPEQSAIISRIKRRLDGHRVVVVYGFAPHAVVERMQREGIRALRSPVDEALLVRELHRLDPVSQSAQSTVLPRAPRVFNDTALKSMAQISATVQCECPHHLVDILRTLNQFEVYSSECENRNDDDAALHAMLAETTAAARSMFEQALIEVAKVEGIELPQSAGAAGD